MWLLNKSGNVRKTIEFRAEYYNRSVPFDLMTTRLSRGMEWNQGNLEMKIKTDWLIWFKGKTAQRCKKINRIWREIGQLFTEYYLQPNSHYNDMQETNKIFRGIFKNSFIWITCRHYDRISERV